MKKPTAQLLVALFIIGFVMLNVAAPIGLGSHAWYVGDVLAVVGILLCFFALLAWMHWYFDAMVQTLTDWILRNTIQRWFNKIQ